MRKYSSEGHRLTDCCGAYSTYSQDGEYELLCCKVCWREVPDGQGDGTEYETPIAKKTGQL
jgi:hypothetical protein